MSLRAVGEGHISSLTFRAGCIDSDGNVTIEPTARLASVPAIQRRTPRPDGEDLEVSFSSPNEHLSERVIFPMTDSQSNGIEDARFVEFDDGERRIFYGTYTAYSGKGIRSELIQTTDFLSFRLTPLSGSAARNKGMALFPRKIDGRYAMIGRQDNENLYLLYSDDLYVWNDGQLILKPEFPWEFVQIGNCGSPIELDEGWLLFTHGVGPIRKYSIGAVLLDKKDPTKGSGPIARTDSEARTVRARRLRPQRGLHLRGHAPWRQDRSALRHIRHLLQFRDHRNCDASARAYGLTVLRFGPSRLRTLPLHCGIQRQALN